MTNLTINGKKRKDEFFKMLQESRFPIIKKRWEFNGMVDGIEYCEPNIMRKDSFIKCYGPGTWNYKILVCYPGKNNRPEPYWEVFDKHGGSVFCFEIML